MPTVTTMLLRQLLDSPAEQAVLYISTENGTPELDVWAGAYVDHHTVVITRDELIDAFGHDWANDDVTDLVAELQEIADDIVNDND